MGPEYLLWHLTLTPTFLTPTFTLALDSDPDIQITGINYVQH